MKLYLVRHGQTDWNATGRLQGHTDIELNETGVRQAKWAATYLEEFKIREIISSPLQRAKRTAEEILKRSSEARLSLSPLVVEKNFGTYEGESVERYLSDRQKSGLEQHNFRPEGGESGEDVLARADMFLGTISQETHQTGLCIVSHGVFLGTLIRRLVGHTPIHENSKYRVTNGSVTILDWPESGPITVDLFNHSLQI